MFRSFLRPFWFTQHLLGQPLVELSGDSARSRTSLSALHVQLLPDGSRNSWTVYGIYRVRLRRTADGWRIAERLFRGLHEEGEVLPAEAVQCFDAPPWLAGDPDAA